MKWQGIPRWLAAAALATLALIAFSFLRSANPKKAVLLGQAIELGLPSASPAMAAAASEPDPDLSAIILARALIARELDVSRAPVASAQAASIRAATSGKRLAWARAAAQNALRRHPASWEAAMILGISTFLDLGERLDPRLYAEPEIWEKPLRSAMQLAPGAPEPPRFLAYADLEIWFALSPPGRERARAALRQAFADFPSFDLLIERWLAVAPDSTTALSVLPAQSLPWSVVVGVYEARQEWPEYLAAHAGFDRALDAEAQSALADAEARLAAGDTAGARTGFLRAATGLTPDAAAAALLTRALHECPAGVPDGRLYASFHAWLVWALDRFLLTGEPPLPAHEMDRVAGLAGNLTPEESAGAALAAENRARAESVERRSEAFWGERWAPYFIAKARWLAAHGDASEAARALADLHHLGRDNAAYWQTRLRVASVQRDAGEEATAQAELERLTRSVWPATAWKWRGGRARLEMLTRAQRDAVVLVSVADAPARGSIFAVSLDGARRGLFIARAGETIAIPSPWAAGLHLLEVEILAGGRAAPGEVRLRG